MNEKELYTKLITAFNLADLPEEDVEEMLLAITETVHKQFLSDVYDKVGEKDFSAIQASSSMGEEFYRTTIKHLVPDYESMMEQSINKTCAAFKQK